MPSIFRILQRMSQNRCQAITVGEWAGVALSLFDCRRVQIGFSRAVILVNHKSRNRLCRKPAFGRPAGAPPPPPPPSPQRLPSGPALILFTAHFLVCSTLHTSSFVANLCCAGRIRQDTTRCH
ncbi:hypothetical protein K461DRAFT_24386 [Myriangium duriaei CBS 260.36]|uniref:Uncharacterized protein n=1 Tax=Myriangium duriaei CBS 260.36 TaxID=1168546 RepID=A0A9P4JAB1_9PEZI|nr:hypothetical protein K461DRAFT_24386 [Myriangium duriaei CBS 260.36]